MLTPLQRPAPPADVLPLFSPQAAGRLERFVPPFQFTSFFAPEDTLLCVLAAERAATAAAEAAGTERVPYVVELTAGSGLVGLRLLDRYPRARLLGVDVDPGAPPVAERNARSLGTAGRARFMELSVIDPACEELLAREPIDVLICNPPYIPEPPGMPLAVEAGSGADGAAHLRRVADLAARVRPRAVALSWCSLGDPAGVAGAMEQAGYRLDALYAVAIADGEYSGLVQPYLETLPTAFLSKSAATRAAMADDQSARFAYVLLAGVWVPGDERGVTGEGSVQRAAGSGERGGSAGAAVDALMRGFVREGLPALRAPTMPCEYRAWLLDRWDEIALRAMLHGALPAARSTLAL